MTAQDLITDLLRQIPIVEDIIEASPTFETVIEVAPQIILNVLLFVIFFFILKWVSMIIYWIVSGIFFSKKKMEGKDKHNFIGAVLGAVQGFIVVFVLFVPFYGFVETLRPVSDAMIQEQVVTEDSGAVSFAANNDDGNENAIVYLNSSVEAIDEYINKFDSVWVNKVMNFIGVKKLGVNMFNELTTVETKKLKCSLIGEIKTIAKAYPYVDSIIDEGFDIKNNEQMQDLKSAINELYDSEILSNMVKEIVKEMSNRWYNGYEFCEISKPEMGSVVTQEIFDLLLFNLSVAEGDAIKTDLDTTIDLVMIANDADLVVSLLNNDNIIDVLSTPENENLVSNLITKAVESKTLKALLPKVIYAGLDLVYDALDIDKTKIDDAEITAEEVVWDSEKLKLQNVFNNVIDIYNQIQDGSEEGKDALESLDFKLLGDTFDNIRFSQLLGPSSVHIMKAILNSNEFVGESQETLSKFVTNLEEVWEGTEPLAPTFESLGKALKLARDLQANKDNFEVGDISGVLAGLTQDENLKDVVSEVINEKTLTDLGLDEQTAGIVNETISSVLELKGEALEAEAKAVEEIFIIANKVINLDTTENPEAKIEKIETNEAEKIVDALAESTTVLDAITKNDSAVNSLDLGNKLDQDSKDNLAEQINALTTEKLEGKTQEEIDELKKTLNDLFGI